VRIQPGGGEEQLSSWGGILEVQPKVITVARGYRDSRQDLDEAKATEALNSARGAQDCPGAQALATAEASLAVRRRRSPRFASCGGKSDRLGRFL